MDINASKKMKAETEIKKCYDMGKITKRQRDTMMKHMDHHTFAHIRKMLDRMRVKETLARVKTDVLRANRLSERALSSGSLPRVARAMAAIDGRLCSSHAPPRPPAWARRPAELGLVGMAAAVTVTVAYVALRRRG